MAPPAIGYLPYTHSRSTVLKLNPDWKAEGTKKRGQPLDYPRIPPAYADWAVTVACTPAVLGERGKEKMLARAATMSVDTLHGTPSRLP